MTSVALIRLSWPDKALWPNRSRGKAWTARKAAEDAYKQEAACAAMGQIGALKAIEAGVVAITFHKANRGRYDLDNAYAAIKPAQDAICAKWGVDDSELNHVTLIRGETVKGGCVLVEIRG